jgi:twitching motility two-component system response regulator PilH
MHKRTVLIIDDDEDLLIELEELLVHSDYSVVAIADGDRALEIAKEIVPDIVLLDLKLGGKSGFQVASEFSRCAETAHIPIIAMSGYYSKTDYDTLKNRSKPQAFIEKPVKPLDIIATIEKIISYEGLKQSP